MLSDGDILALLGDGDVSDIGSEVDELEDDNCFPIDEFDQLLNDFDDLSSDILPDIEEVEPDFINTNKRDIHWVQKPFEPPTINLEDIESEYIDTLKTPIQYFSEYFGDDIFVKIAFNTNLYATQKNLGSKFKLTDEHEIKTLIGIHMLMGCLKYSRVRMYWQKRFFVHLIADNMSRNRFFNLRTNFHVIDNNDIPPCNKDKFIKVRPLCDSFLRKCKSLPVEKNICVDEQMVPFKGKLCIKQYVKNKPIKWGIKIFLLCGESGLAYNLFLFQGFSELDPENIKTYGSGGSVVLRLTENIKPNRHFLFFDNYFSSYGLFEKLLHDKIYAVGTIRANWFAKPPFLSDKLMRELGRGTSFEITTDQPNNYNIGLLKWYDNKPVHLGSNFVTSGELDVVRRWSKKEKKYVDIERPEIVRIYNQSMGGVDKMDQMVSYYRICIRSNKWTLRMAMHFFDLAICNSWIQYKKHAEILKIPKKKIMDSMDFRMDIAESLIRVNKPSTPNRKRGRPSAQAEPVPEETYTKRNVVDSAPPNIDVRLDGTYHRALVDERKYATKCKHPTCKRRTHTFCSKCNLHLCLDRTSNCFDKYHTK